MKFLKIVFIFVISVLMIVQILLVESVFAQPQFGIGANGGFALPYTDYPQSAIALSGGVLGRYLFSDRFNLSLGIGFSRLTDNNDEYMSYLNQVDLMANFNLIPEGIFIPYLSAGLGAFSFQYFPHTNKPAEYQYTRIPNTGITQGENYYDGSFIIGGGVDLFVSPQVAITALADYRFTTGDDLDGFNNQDSKGSKDGYLNARFGLTYYLGQRRAGRGEEDLLALQRVEFGEVEDDILRQLESGDNLPSLDNQLTGPGSQSALQSRYQELTQNIDEKQREITELQQNLSFKDQRIADLENEIQKGGGSIRAGAYSSTGSFSDDYQNALQTYYAKNYMTAINLFQDLKNRFPNHKLTSNCDYWTGESYFGLANYKMAIQAFQNVFTHSFSYKKDDATLMLGRCYMKMNDFETARNYLQELLNKYPDSEYVGKAKEWLNRIG